MKLTPKGMSIASLTAVGVVAVFALNPQDTTAPSSEQAQVPTSPSSTSTGTASASPDATAQGAPTAAPQTTAAPQATAAPAPTGTDGTYTGTTYQSTYGPMQVTATISGGQLTDVSWVQLPPDHHSQGIADQATPILVQDALETQSAQVNTVSGATYTSEGFRRSLQSALDQAGL